MLEDGFKIATRKYVHRNFKGLDADLLARMEVDRANFKLKTGKRLTQGEWLNEAIKEKLARCS